MSQHSYLTITSIVGHNDGASSIPALSRTLQELPGSIGLLISTSKPKNLPSNIKWKQTLPLDYRQYSVFVMFSLQNFIETDFCLIVQDDGWIIDGNNWSNDFLNYDYIGAPCHAAFVGNELVQGFQWAGTSNPKPVIIQNGGLSFRSMKLLKAPSSHGALYYFSNENVLQNEDVQLSGIFRSELESLGIKFAPDGIAKHFSVEYLGPIFHDDLNFSKLFGVHGQTRKLISENLIYITIPKNQLHNIHRESELLDYLTLNLNYEIQFAE
jgi:hypothetical protein